jgi:GGDEF domain-containing protein
MGGEEFALVLFDTDRDAAQRAVTRIGMALVRWSRDEPCPLTASAGISNLGP